MYKNLIGEIARNGITKKEVAHLLGINHNTLNRKLQNKNEFTIEESKKLLKLFKDKTFEYLFTEE